jgi:YspA, cpYpsA-related SLOG family
VRVVVCGSRSWSDEGAIRHRVLELPLTTVIIHGAAQGADAIAQRIALLARYRTIPCPADWKRFGDRAGPIRNRAMLAWEPDLVIAFRNDGASPGTDDLVREARRRSIPVELHRP